MGELAKVDQFSQVEKRRQAYNLAVRGNSARTVAMLMGVSSTTAKKWINEYKNEIRGTAAQINREEYATLLMSRMEQLRAEAWTKYASAKKEGDQRQWLRMVMDIEMREKDSLLDLGLLERQVQKVEHEHKATIGLGENDVRPEQLDALAALALSGSMGLSPEQALGMCGRPAAELPTPYEYRPPSGEIEDAEIIPYPIVDEAKKE